MTTSLVPDLDRKGGGEGCCRSDGNYNPIGFKIYSEDDNLP